MKTFAYVTGNVVTNIIVANTLEDAQLVLGNSAVEYTEENPAGIGWTYDPETNTFAPPIIEN